MSKDKADSKKKVEVSTHDMWKLIMLQAHDFEVIRIDKHPARSGGRDILHYVFNGAEAKEISDAWDRGKDKTPVMKTARKLKMYQELFKENLRRLLP